MIRQAKESACALARCTPTADLSAETRDEFRVALPVDDATWARGRGWALSFGLIALSYYRNTNPVLAGIARYAIDEALPDDGRS